MRATSYEVAHLTNLLGAFITTLNDELTLALEEVVGAAGATPAALVAIDTWPDCSIEFLRGVVHLTQSGTVRLVDRLEAEALVARSRGADRRAVALRVTVKGRVMMRHAREARECILGRVIGTLSEAEQRELSTVLHRVLRTETRSRTEAQHSCRLCDHSVCRDEACPIGSSVPQE